MTAVVSPPPSAYITPRESGPIRVCHVSLTLKTGGLERILADLARHHHRDHCQHGFVALREVGRFATEIEQAGCPVWQIPGTSQWEQVRALAALFRRESIDVVHTHNTYPHIYGTLAARLAGVPVVVQTRHGQRAGHGWKSRWLYRSAAYFVDRVVAVSDDAARLCVQSDGLPTRKVQRIWNGIDLGAFRYQGPAPGPVAISVARLSPEKDFPTLLRAVEIARRTVPALHLKLVGDGPERARLETLCDELALRPNVEFLGERTDVPALLETASFFVSASLTEGISLTLLEAMAVGLPVVATNAGGNPEIVMDRETGLITPVGDVDRLAAAIVQMAQQPERWEQFGRAGCDRVHRHFDVQRMVQDYETLYERLLARKRRSRRSASLATASSR